MIPPQEAGITQPNRFFITDAAVILFVVITKDSAIIRQKNINPVIPPCTSPREPADFAEINPPKKQLTIITPSAAKGSIFSLNGVKCKIAVIKIAPIRDAATAYKNPLRAGAGLL